MSTQVKVYVLPSLSTMVKEDSGKITSPASGGSIMLIRRGKVLFS